MFVRYFVEVPPPADRVERALVDSPAGWLSGLADAITLSAAGGAATMRS